MSMTMRLQALYTQRYRRAISLALLLLLASGSALAGVAEVRKQAEASMLVTGTVFIAPDGTVQKLDVNDPEKLPPGVRKLVESAGQVWRFEPYVVDGVAKLAKARMSLRVVAKQLEGGDYSLQLRSAYFGKEALSAEERVAKEGESGIRSQSLKPPIFPQPANIVGATCEVYVIVKVGRDGHVQEAFVEQVNMLVVARESMMDQLREMFSKSAVRGAKQWTFSVPTQGELADDPFWLVRVPVDYLMQGTKRPGYGEWSIYVPGPKQRAPWDNEKDGMGDPDAMVAGEVYPVGQGVRLLTPLQSG